MGADGFRTNYAGRKVWFVTARNEVIEARIAREAVRNSSATNRQDYTILLFDRDLPPGIEPMSVAATTNVLRHYPFLPGAPYVIFQTEQGGNVSVPLPGFMIGTWKGGDSGSPDMLPLPDELVFLSGRSTTGPTPQMQSDMDELCSLQKLDPKRYQMRWVDLSRYPDYGAAVGR
jgi:hypothetical protein